MEDKYNCEKQLSEKEMKDYKELNEKAFGPEPLIFDAPKSIEYQPPFISKPRKKRRQDLFKK